MSFLLKDVIHKTIADSIFNEIFSGRSNYYFYTGKVSKYPDESVPPAPDDTQFGATDTRNRIINVKKLTTNDLSFVVARKNWDSGTIYDQFDGNYSVSNPATSGATSLKSSNFYVLTSNFQVYKCISNNNGAQSTVEPASTDLAPFSLADGYKWKFMYTIPLSLRTRFLTNDFMPVQKDILNPYYNNGEIDNVIINNKGQNYDGNAVVSLSFASPGNVTFGFRGSPGSDGNVTPVLKPVLDGSGSFVKVIIENAGNNIKSANIAVVDLDNTGSNLFANVKVGNTLFVSNTGGSTGNAILLPVLQNGILKEVVVADPGIGYSSNIRTFITVQGDGSNAAFQPFINASGEIEDVIITSRGEGFTNAELNVVGAGTGADLSVSFEDGDLDTSQSLVELSAVPGAIYNLIIDNAGENFINPANAAISIIGDGTGFDASITLSGSPNNNISSVTINEAGSGFTYANVQITGSGSNSGTGGANITAILPPENGHGFDAVAELFADTLMFFSTINNEEIHNIIIDNDFRQFGLLKDIEIFGEARAFANSLGTPTFLATFDTLSDGGSEIAKDAVLELASDTSRKFEVVDTVTANTQMLLTSLNNHTLVGTDVLKSVAGTSFTVTTVNQNPTINKFSGDLVFIDNRTQVSFTEDQLVSFRTILTV